MQTSKGEVNTASVDLRREDRLKAGEHAQRPGANRGREDKSLTL
jgi:hypothetical protein